MEINLFSHPDFCATVFRRSAETALMDAFCYYAEFLTTGGRSAWRSQAYRSRTGYWNAVNRLRNQGIVAYRRKGGRDPILHVKAVQPSDEAVYHPETYWNQRWSGRWHMLVYDVPESNRRYREQLRRVLLQNRCGCLQGSVWISTRDLRPLFADLDEAAALSNMAYLLEARTVLGRSQLDLVEEAWDFDHLESLHTRYRAEVKESLALLASLTEETHVATLAYQEAAAFRTVIDHDPLLPAPLHPSRYVGREILALHQRFVEQVQRHGLSLRH